MFDLENESIEAEFKEKFSRRDTKEEVEQDRKNKREKEKEKEKERVYKNNIKKRKK